MIPFENKYLKKGENCMKEQRSCSDHIIHNILQTWIIHITILKDSKYLLPA